MSDLRNRIDRLTDQLAKAKAQQILKAQTEKNRTSVKNRKERDRAIYKAGALVEKMGLLGLAVADQDLFLGVLDKYHQVIEAADQTRLDAYRSNGRQFSPIGKKLDGVKPSSKIVAKPEAAQQTVQS